jgi:phage tail sheath protein FI
MYLVDPYVKVFNSVTQKEQSQPGSSRAAGVIVKSDQDRGFWYSPSNREIKGITGTARAIDFAMGDSNARANLLNEQDITTVIHQSGYRLWGNHTCSSDAKWQFISVRRTADMINDSLLRAHLWAVDRNITSSYVESVVSGINAYLRHLKSIGAILGGNCWADPELNSKDQIQLGRVTFSFDFTPPYPAESIVFRSQMVDNYLEEII